MMFLEVLGPLRLIDASGAVVDIGPPRVRRLLARLALEPERTVSLSALEEALWDLDQAPSRPDKAIQDTVADLRAVLRRAGLAGLVVSEANAGLRAGEFSIVRSSTPAGYALVGVTGRTDVVAAESAFRLIVPSNRPAGVRQAEVQAMLSLWRGEPYADLGDHPPAVAERLRLQALWWQAQEIRFEMATELNDMVTLAEAPSLLIDDSSHWRLWSSWIRGLANAGRTADALAVVQQAHEAWANRGVDLAPELVALEQSIASGSFQAYQPARTSAINTSTAASLFDVSAEVARFEPARARPVCIGREVSVGSLQRAYHRAGTGVVQFVAITGEQGIGKTTLLRSFIASSLAGLGNQPHVLEGACFDDEVEPYAPMASVVRGALTRAEGSDLLSALNPTGLAALQRMVAHVGDSQERIATSSTPDDQPAAPTRDGSDIARQALVEVLRRLTSTGPLILAIEDLHWLKDQGADLLLQVLRRVEGLPLMIVATVRSPSGLPVRLWRKVMEEASRHCEITELSLSGLDIDALVELVQLHAPNEQKVREVATEFKTKTGGHPFYTRELLRYAEEQRRAHPESDPGLSNQLVPPSVELVVRSRFQNLTDESVSLLNTASVIGPVWDSRIVSSMMGVSLASASYLNAIDEILDTGFARVRDAVSFEFAHEIVRHVIRDSLPAHRRHAFHTQAALALEAAAGSNAAVSAQWLAAGAAGDVTRAAESTLAAATAEMDVYANSSAHERLSSLRTWLVANDALTPESAFRIELTSADATTRLGLIEVSKSHAKHAFELALALPAGPMRSNGLVDSVFLHLVYSLGSDADPESLALARRCLQEDIPAVWRANLRARILLHEEQWSTVSLGNQAELADLEREAALHLDPDLSGEVAWVSFHIKRGNPDPAQRLALSEQLLRIGSDRTRSTRSTIFLANGLRASILTYAELGQRLEFDRAIAELEEWSNQRGSRIYVADVIRWKATALATQGDWTSATALNDGLQDVSLGQPLLQLGNEVQRIHFQRRQGLDIDMANLALAIDLAGGMSPVLRCMRAAVFVERGDLGAAQTDLDDVVIAPLGGLSFAGARCPVDGLFPAAEVVAAIGTDAQVETVEDALRPYSGQLAVTLWGEFCQGAIDRALGRLAIRRQRPDEAMGLLEAALRLELQFGAAAEAAITQRLLTEL
jgi:AAA ATPase domain/Bacterial transcriptional activator domain